MRDDTTRCPNPRCHDGEVYYRGTTGPTGDDPSGDQDCPVCNGSGRVHTAWTRSLIWGYCTCRRYTMLGAGGLCHTCWRAVHLPDLTRPELLLDELPC